MRDRAISVTRTSWVGLAAIVAMTAGAVAIVLTGAPPDERVIAALTHGLLVAAPAGVGLAVLARRPDDRFARALLASGALWALTALVWTSGSLPYSVGRVATWVIEGAVVYLLLSFPSGHLSTTLERLTFRATVLVVAMLYLPTALLVEHYPDPFEGHACAPDCPANAFAVTSSQPAIVDDVIRPLRETITVAIFLVVVGILARRTWRAGPMLRRALIPVTAAAAIRGAVFPFYFIARAARPEWDAIVTITWAYLLSLALIPLSFGAGLLVRRLYGALALQHMALRLRADSTVADLRKAMAAALEDPSLRIVYWRNGDAGHWIDETGWPVRAPQGGDGRAVTEVDADGRRVAAIVHDARLAQDPAVVRAAGAYAVMVLEHGRLVERLRSSLLSLSESRARIAAVGDEARRGLERDLHDGAQQRLVALRLKLGREGDRLRATDPDAAEDLDALGEDVEDTIDEVRGLAHGIYPSLLADRGLPDALRAAVFAAPISTSLDSDGIGRYRRDIESTIYFACLEAMQNAAKHAHGASHVEISLTDDGRLGFAVADDGAGFDTTVDHAGAGLTNLRDRLSAVGGELTIESHLGVGTRVAGSVPVATNGTPATA